MAVPAAVGTVGAAAVSAAKMAAKSVVGVPVQREFEADVRIWLKAMLWACERPPWT